MLIIRGRHMNDFQAKLLEILKAFIAVCDKHNLRWQMCAGSVLGAVRHKGFIPWDDDVDVMMPREDYNKFIKLQKEFEGTPYFIQTWRSDPHYTYNYAKLRDSSTTFIENFYVNHRINHGLWVDIFPIDGMSKEVKDRKKLGKKLIYPWYNSYMVYLPSLLRKFRKETFLKDLGLNTVGCLFWLFNPFHVRQRIVDKYVSHLSLDEAKMAGTFFEFNIKIAAMNTAIFLDSIDVDFEDIKVKIPKLYDEYLTNMYGDYMTPPPLDKQVGGHHDKGTSLTEGYESYMRRNRI